MVPQQREPSESYTGSIVLLSVRVNTRGSFQKGSSRANLWGSTLGMTRAI